MPPVKYQILSCQGAEILVGRLKIEIPDGGHAFILRRFDTNALSVTTMFRAAFPTSSEADERAEITWVKDNHDLLGNNGSSKEPHLTRLAGTWVGPELAMELAESYGLSDLVHSMVVAKPDPKAAYRRSHKSNAASANGTPTTAQPTQHAAANGSPVKPAAAGTHQKPPSKTLPTPSPTGPATKRRREASPAPPTEAPVPSTQSVPKTPGSVRRSARAKSPAPKGGPIPLTGLSASKPRSRSSVAPPSPKKRDVDLPKASLSPIKGDESVVEQGVAGTTLYEEDVSEQRQLIADLKKKRELAAAQAAKNEEEMEQNEQEQDEEEDEDTSEPSQLKRVREEEDQPLTFNFKEPETEERQIATNTRVGGRFKMEPRTKSVAWGLAAFAVGMGAVSFLPNLL